MVPLDFLLKKFNFCNFFNLSLAKYKFIKLFFCTILIIGLVSKSLFASELLIIEAEGCYYCEIWDKEVGSIYNDNKIGSLLPLRRVNIKTVRSRSLKAIKNVYFTPTFIVLNDGIEIGRITGYPGEGFFWGYLENIVEKLRASNMINKN